MKVSVEIDGKFKLSGTGFQFGNLMESINTIPVFHYLAQYVPSL